MQKRFDPAHLEPKDGDFAGFVEKLNQKSIQDLKALQVNDELMREQINDELNGAASGVWSSPNIDPAPIHRDTVINQPEDAFKVDPSAEQKQANNSYHKSNRAGNLSTFLLIFSGFALFSYGGMSGDEEIIAISVFLIFISIVSNIVRQKRNRRR